MTDFHSYSILKDSENYVDNINQSSIFNSTVTVGHNEYHVCLIPDDWGIQMIRVSKMNIQDEKISSQEIEEINSIKEQCLNTLNLCFDYMARERFNITTYNDKGEEYRFDIKIEKQNNFDPDLFEAAFAQTLLNTDKIQHHIKLLTDSRKNYIPIQYRFLSLYKLLELEFKSNGKWNREFDQFVERIENPFKEQKLTERTFKNYLHEVRDKCAHIKSSKDVLGVTSLSKEDNEMVKQFLEFLSYVCTEYINQIKLKNTEFKIRHHSVSSVTPE